MRLRLPDLVGVRLEARAASARAPDAEFRTLHDVDVLPRGRPARAERKNNYVLKSKSKMIRKPSLASVLPSGRRAGVRQAGTPFP